jgi:hypothetical protein
MSKIHPRGIVATKPGPTITKNDPAKFHGAGKTSGKTPSNGVVKEGEGPTITCNETLIPTPNADKAPMKTKVVASRGDGPISLTNTASQLTASQGGSGGPTDPPYALDKSYPKHKGEHAEAARRVKF